eukprot:CAMPEP_0181241210 /NCGR_PEP_ID=MMETSP1096-20121128/40992_1 /TAXON_ID=156174 ORGANISM="Chrysochromulina ericina, Strain CCMP281" /NCGR_SAMPLE_ID=MMETSP1096 /ASSEMBLY_ACC=CAM_ASM_000453 /LENGTH=31 /DNA_ID= /DNA_START= /DNA_END= /DNA_ORIENTATION=
MKVECRMELFPNAQAAPDWALRKALAARTPE